MKAIYVFLKSESMVCVYERTKLERLVEPKKDAVGQTTVNSNMYESF